MAQHFRAVAAHAEEQVLVLSTHVVAHNFLL